MKTFYKANIYKNKSYLYYNIYKNIKTNLDKKI